MAAVVHPLHPAYEGSFDQELIETALQGSQTSLSKLVQRHQHFIYNLALKMVLSPADAEDITQEILIKMVTKLSQFQGRSQFRTWLYRITFNHILSLPKRPLEQAITTFDAYGETLNQIPNVDLSLTEQMDQREWIEEAKLGCLMGMLLCLNREQRSVYILGEIFEVPSQLGGELLEITPANFRKRLERARKDLYQFMNRQCGLINPDNPCRCVRKTTGFIQAGWVDKQQKRFHTDYLQHISEQVVDKQAQLEGLMDNRYQQLFQETPFQEKAHHERLMRNILGDPEVRQLFQLDCTDD